MLLFLVGFGLLRIWGQPVQVRLGFAITAVCLCYFILAVGYAVQLPLIMDEYANAYRVQRLVEGWPYVDFQPYTTTLALYLQLLPFSIFEDSWWQLITVKIFNISLVTAALFWLGRVVAKKHSPFTVICCLFALILHSTFLERSGAFRVDMMSSICGFVGLALALQNKHRWSSVWVGVAFLATQKAALFVVALAGAEFFRFLRFRTKPAFRRLLESAGFVLLPLVVYFSFFSAFSSVSTVFETTFVAPQAIATEDLYDLQVFWGQTLKRNPVFYGIAGFGLVFGPLLAVSKKDYREEQKYLTSYSAVLLALCLVHKQPWPYFFVMLVPTAAIVSIYFLEQLRGFNEKLADSIAAVLVIAALGLALFRVPVVLSRDAELQRTTRELAKGMLTEEDSYLAGVPMLWENYQTPGLRWLDHQASVKLHKTPLPVFRKLKQEPPTVIIWSHRIANLPPQFRDWFKGRYTLLGANVLAPGTRFDATTSSIQLWKTGAYKLILPPGEKVELGPETFENGAVVELTSGIYPLKSGAKGRIVLWPKDPAIARLATLEGGTLYYRPYTF